jgi:signal transduction histidine kinase
VKRRLVASYVAVALVILVALEVPLGVVYARHERDIASSALTRDAESMASIAAVGLEGPGVDLRSVASQYRRRGGDVAVFGPDGGIVVPPGGDEAELVSSPVHAEVAAVLAGRGPRTVHTVDGGELFAVALVGSTDHRVGVVAVTGGDSNPSQRIRAAVMAMLLVAAILLVVVAVLGWLVANSVTVPLTELRDAAVRLGHGDLKARSRGATGPPEIRSLAGSFNVMAARLEELVDAHKAFAADASHQLRSPLTALRLRLENVAADLPHDQADAVEDALREADRLRRVVDGLLALARSDGQRPTRAVVDVAAIVADRHGAWLAFAEERDVSLRCELHGSAAPAWAVPGYVEQILDNLISNAIEATPAGRCIWLRLGGQADHVVIEVVDEGIGMTVQDRAHAFDRFWRGSAGRSAGGTGLGLAIVGQLARSCDADVELLATASGGVDAVVRLEAATDDASPSTAGATITGAIGEDLG